MKNINQLLAIFSTLMTTDGYPVARPVDPDVLANLINKSSPEDWDELKKTVYADIQRLMINRPDYSEMFSVMDGLEYNGLTLYSVVQAENGQPLWSNIYIRNVEARDNQIYVDPNLADGVLIGEDGMSLFTYHLTEDCFQILDKASTEYIIESHQDFSGFLSAIIDIVN